MTNAFAVDQAIAVASFKGRIAYKVHWLLAIGVGCGGMLVAMAMWRELIGSGLVFGYDWESMQAYLIIGFFTTSLALSHADFQMARRILDGLVAVDLTKPVDYQRARAAEFMGSMLATMPTAMLGATIAWIVFAPPPPASFTAGMLTLVSIALIVPLSFNLLQLSTLVCFWTRRYVGVMWLREALLGFFSGLMIPLAMMPHWLQVFAWCLPFPHFTTTPTAIYLGRVDTLGALGLIAAEAAWIGVMWFVAKKVFKRGVQEVTVHGG